MIDAILSVLTVIVGAASMAQNATDTLVILAIGALMIAAFSGTLSALGVEWMFKKTRTRVRSLISRLVTS